MGFPGHFKIAGHSGTSFKHRKAFDKRKAYQKQSSNTKKSADKTSIKLPIKSSVPTDYQKAYQQERRFKLFFKLPVFLITIIVIGFVIVNSSSHYKEALNARNHSNKIELEMVMEAVQREDYLFLVNSGYYYYRRKKLDTAQWEFTRALSIDEYGKEARIGLTRTLIEQCKEYHRACDEISENIEFIRGMKYMSDSKIKEMEEQVDLVYSY